MRLKDNTKLIIFLLSGIFQEIFALIVLHILPFFIVKE